MAILTVPESAAKVQQVSKASSDKLLRKFAEAESDSDTEPKSSLKKSTSRPPKRRRKVQRGVPEGESSLLAPATPRPRSVVLRRLGISRVRDVKNRSVLGSIQKTWSKAVRGASRVFIEKHYNSHKRLISDMA